MNKILGSKKRIIIVGLIFVALLLLVAWVLWAQSYKPHPPVSRTFYNVIVLLDLSDRIKQEKAPFQIEKDKQVIANIVDVFEAKVRSSLYLLSQDRLTLKVAIQDNSGYENIVTKMADGLIIDAKALRGAPAFKPRKKEMLENVNNLYSSAAQPLDFIGADIWSFFRDNLENHLVTSRQHKFKNILIILTDGYLDFNKQIQQTRPKRANRTSYMEVQRFRNSSNWRREFDTKDYGLMSIDKDFKEKNLSVLILEVKYRDLRDKEIIYKYWRKWLEEMGVNKVQIATTDDSPSVVKDVIERFIE